MREDILEKILESSNETFFIIGKRECMLCTIVTAYLREYQHPYILFELDDTVKPVVDHFLTKHRKAEYKLPVVIRQGRLLDGFDGANEIMDFLKEHYEND